MAAIRHYWPMVLAAVAFRVLLVVFSGDLLLASRPEVATPVTSLRRLAEGYWLKQASMSPYAGSMYHGSPLLLHLLGPLTNDSSGGQLATLKCSLIFVVVDFITAMLIRATGQKLHRARSLGLQSLKLTEVVTKSANASVGDIASLIYLWNPWGIVTCVGSSTSPIENLMVVLTVYGACSGQASLAAFGFVMATHLSLYPVILIVPVTILLGYGLDTAPPKLVFAKSSQTPAFQFSWRPVLNFLLWVLIWSCYVLILSSFSLSNLGGLREMFTKTYGVILTVKDLSPNIGVLWYFFAEVFESYRDFFLIVFHMNILFIILPLAIRLKHRPCFLVFVYTAILAMLKSYPSFGDLALFVGFMGLFANELADMQFTFFLFFGYIGVSLLSPVMHSLWIWRGTGNSNFYYATGLVFSCLQTVLIVESVSTVLKYDRSLKKLVTSTN